MNQKRVFYFLFLFLCLLNFLDLIFTYLGISKYGFESESNGFLICMIKNFGWSITSFFKIIIVPISGLPLIKSVSVIKYRKFIILCNISLIIMCCIFIEVLYNWSVIL